VVTISRLARLTLLTLFWANFLNFFDRQVLAALAPLLKGYWQLDDYQVGLLATAFEVTYALAPLPIAILADRWWRRRVVALALAVWSGAMALTGAAGSFAALLVGRAVLGLGEAGYGPSALAWLSDLFPPSHRSRAVGVHDLALMVGSAAGYALGGVSGQALGWRPVFILAALPGWLLAVAVWLLPEPTRGQSDRRAVGLGEALSPGRPVPLATARRELLAVPTFVVMSLVGTLINLATAGLIYWLPAFAVRFHGLGVDKAGLLTGALTVVAGAAGVLSGGLVADRLLRYTPAGRLLTLSASYAVGFPLALAAILTRDTGLFLLLATLAVYLFAFYLPCLAPLIHQVTRPELRATAMGLCLFLIHLLGNAPAPALVGRLSDLTGDLRLGLAVALFPALLGAAIGLWGTRFVGRDTRAMLSRL